VKWLAATANPRGAEIALTASPFAVRLTNFQRKAVIGNIVVFVARLQLGPPADEGIARR